MYGDAKLGVGSASDGPLIAPAPMPRAANAFHSRSALAPSKRSASAVIMLSRMSSMLTCPVAASRNESNTSCAQRRLPGHAVAGVAPSAQLSCRARVPEPYRAIRLRRMSKLVALQISPSECTAGTRSYPMFE